MLGNRRATTCWLTFENRSASSSFFLSPTNIDRLNDNILEVVREDSAYEENTKVVFNCGELRIIHARLFNKLLRPLIELNPHRLKSELGLSRERPGPFSHLVDDTMLPRFDSFLKARLALVC